eukprot:235757-Amorphochlora_amoeboformis.AAC.1
MFSLSSNTLESSSRHVLSPNIRKPCVTTEFCRLLPDEKISKILWNLQQSPAICTRRPTILQHAIDM